MVRFAVPDNRRFTAAATRWDTYQKWILTGAQQAAAKAKPGGKGYIIEWAVNFNPCLEVEPGKFYSTSMGDRAMGLNIALGDLDEMERGVGNFGNFHHEDWFAGAKNIRTQVKQWGTLWIRSTARKSAAQPPQAPIRLQPPTKN